MKVGIFADTYEPHISGVTTSINMLKRSLEEKHHEVYIVTANLENSKFIYNKKKKIIYIPGIKTGIYSFRLTNIFSRKAFKIIKNWNLDIIHSQTEFSIGIFSRIVAKKLNIPVVYTYHTLYEDYTYYVTHGHFNNLGKKLAIKITKHACLKCDELIVPSLKIKELFKTKYQINRKINVIPTGVDLDKFNTSNKLKIKELKKKYKIKDNDFIIGSVGRIAKEKSFDLLIKAFKDLYLTDNNIKLLIVGDGPEKEDLEALTKELNLEKNVIFTGLIDYNLIPTYYSLFNIMATFSTSETQGLTLIEALASSTPVLCINDQSFKSVITNNYNGYLFSTTNDFKSYIIKLKSNSELQKKLERNAKESVYKFSKEEFAKNILKVYKQALNNFWKNKK